MEIYYINGALVILNRAPLYEGYTALIAAAIRGHKNIVELLLKNNANVNLESKYGETALIEAAQYGHKEVVELLIQYNADVNARLKYGSRLECILRFIYDIEHTSNAQKSTFLLSTHAVNNNVHSIAWMSQNVTGACLEVITAHQQPNEHGFFIISHSQPINNNYNTPNSIVIAKKCAYISKNSPRTAPPPDSHNACKHHSERTRF